MHLPLKLIVTPPPAVPSQKKKRGVLVKATIVSLILTAGLFATTAFAQIPVFDGFRTSDRPEDVSATLEILGLLTVLSLAPSIFLMTTCFLRIIIVLSFVKRALSTQEIPPSQVVTGLALILTFFIMKPTFVEIKDKAWVPYMDEEITLTEAYHIARVPMRDFMFRNTREVDLVLFLDIAGVKYDPGSLTRGQISTSVLMPAFVTSELRRGFEMGFVIYLPFLVIDLVIASILISMGMMVLPPILISLPFKILLFVLVDGWGKILGSLALSFPAGTPVSPG
ncbi:MAG: flagellar type III secretion system pore protein FliP [Planctomycetes bacterium]|nr:flagellar type III secretion system pore protein FliP [Planctomycetota bacterium]